jgi:hypothetical protein
LRDHGKTVARKLVNALRHEPAAVPLLTGQEATVDPAWEYAQLLLEHLKQFQLTNFILKINEDVLGIYDYGGTEPKIELYWGVIGLVARDLNIGVEDLTCVVLAHEFAHAFTHVGSDANHLSMRMRRVAQQQRSLELFDQFLADAAHQLDPGVAPHS